MYLMTAPTITPATASGSSGHQGGVPWKPRSFGRSVNTQAWMSAISLSSQ
jgi:hypothetical protein